MAARLSSTPTPVPLQSSSVACVQEHRTASGVADCAARVAPKRHPVLPTGRLSLAFEGGAAWFLRWR